MRLKQYERLTVRAAIDHSHEAAGEAFARNAVVGRGEIAEQVLSDYIREFSQKMKLQAT